MRKLLLLGWIAMTGCPEPGEPDCSACTDDELCAFTYDLEGAIENVCLSWPAVCDTDRTCACIDANLGGKKKAASSRACDQRGWEQNSNACTVVDDRVMLECESQLGR